MRVSKILLIAAAASVSMPLSAQEANDTAYADNTAVADPAASDANAVDANAVVAPDPLADPAADPALTADPAATDTAVPASDGGGGFPWGVLGLLGLLGLIPRLRR